MHPYVDNFKRHWPVRNSVSALTLILLCSVSLSREQCTSKDAAVAGDIADPEIPNPASGTALLQVTRFAKHIVHEKASLLQEKQTTELPVAAKSSETMTTAATTTSTTSDVCDESAWPDKDRDLVCGDCKVLVNRFSSKYKTCSGYCANIGMDCASAWDEQKDSCNIKFSMTCDQTLFSSDAICECKATACGSFLAPSCWAQPACHWNGTTCTEGMFVLSSKIEDAAVDPQIHFTELSARDPCSLSAECLGYLKLKDGTYATLATDLRRKAVYTTWFPGRAAFGGTNSAVEWVKKKTQATIVFNESMPSTTVPEAIQPSDNESTALSILDEKEEFFGYMLTPCEWLLVFCSIGCGVLVFYGVSLSLANWVMSKRAQDAELNSNSREIQDAESSSNSLEIPESVYSSMLTVLLYKQKHRDHYLPGGVFEMVIAPSCLFILSVGLAITTLYFVHRSNIDVGDDFEGALSEYCVEFNQSVLKNLSEELSIKGNIDPRVLELFRVRSNQSESMINCIPPEWLWYYVDELRGWEDESKILNDMRNAGKEMPNWTDASVSNVAERLGLTALDYYNSISRRKQFAKEQELNYQLKKQAVRGMRTDGSVLNTDWMLFYYEGIHNLSKQDMWKIFLNPSLQFKPFLDTCLLMDKKLCGNAMCRMHEPPDHTYYMGQNYASSKVVNATLPLVVHTILNQDVVLWNTEDTAVLPQPVLTCGEIIEKICPQMMSTVFATYQEKRNDVCGVSETTTAQRGPFKIPVAQFETDKIFYNTKTGRNGILFKVCLVGMVVLLTSRVAQEYFEVNHWVLSMLAKPEWKEKGGQSQPIEFRTQLLFGVALLVQFVVSSATLAVGVIFLLQTLEYRDLVLNSVALVFILEIDDLLFKSFAPPSMVSFQKTIKVQSRPIGNYTPGIANTLILVVLTGAVASQVYPYVTSEIRNIIGEKVHCFCQMEGENCLAAKLFGHGSGFFLDGTRDGSSPPEYSNCNP